MNRARPRVLFYVQHLLGIGHLMRAATLARAFEAAGLETVLVTGGMPVPGLDPGPARVVQLPPTRATDLYFKVLVDETGSEIDDAWKAARTDRLLALLDEAQPDIVLTELFPFGRRQMRFELLPLIDAARAMRLDGGHRPLIVSSVRDILVEPGKPERIDEMVARVRALYDLVLIHGDPALIAFDETFPRMREIADLSRYTGYVAEPAPPTTPDGPGAGEVIVSTGGGAVSDAMLQAVLDARPMTALAETTWRVLIGHALPEDEFARWRDTAAPDVIVERARPDFATLLANCTLSISQGGYNTVMEILATGARAVCLPYAGGLESEQTLRCRLLAGRGALETVEAENVGPEAVAAAIGRALARPRGAAASTVDMNGAAASAALLHDALAAR